MQKAFALVFFACVTILASALASWTSPEVSVTPTQDVNGVRELSIPELAAKPGDTITVPLNIISATGLAGADIWLTYDNSVLEVNEVKLTDLTADMNMEFNTNIAGEIIVAMARAEGVTADSGSLIDIIFTVSASAEVGTETAIELKEAAVYNENAESMDMSTQNGKVTITCVKGDINSDGEINSGDAVLALRISVDLLTPTAWQKCAADMNDDTVINSADATAILLKAVGLAAPGTGALAGGSGQITVTLAEVHGVAGESIKVPMKVDKTYALAGGDICISYDKRVLRAVDVSSRSGILLASNVSEPGVVRIAFANAGSLNGETLAEIQFDVLADDASPLKFQRAEFHNPYALPLSSRSIDNEFRSWAMPAEHSALLQNFPNPFNPETWIPYQLNDTNEVTIRIYSPAGQLVRTLELGHKPAGFYTSRARAAYWDGRNESGEEVSSGVYFYSLQAGDFSAVRKLIVLK